MLPLRFPACLAARLTASLPPPHPPPPPPPVRFSVLETGRITLSTLTLSVCACLYRLMKQSRWLGKLNPSFIQHRWRCSVSSGSHDPALPWWMVWRAIQGQLHRLLPYSSTVYWAKYWNNDNNKRRFQCCRRRWFRGPPNGPPMEIRTRH